MANIATEIKNFLTAIYGKDVRASMVSLAEKLNHEVENNTTDAKNAADRANTSASNADVATTKANTATERANTAASNAEKATSEAQVATQNANTATGNANTAAGNANAAANRVDTAINAANTAAENANQQALNAQNAAGDARAIIEETQIAKQAAMTAADEAHTAANSANAAAENANQAAANANSMPDRVADLEKETTQLKGDLAELPNNETLIGNVAEVVKTEVPLVKVAEQPTIVSSIDKMTDTSKVYVLSSDMEYYQYEETKGVNYNLFKISEVSYQMRLQDDAEDMVSSNTSNLVTGWIPVEYGKRYAFSVLKDGSRTVGGVDDTFIVRANAKKADNTVVVWGKDFPNASSTNGVALTILDSDIVAVQLHINISRGTTLNISTPTLLGAYEPMIVAGDTADEAVQNAINLSYLDGDAEVEGTAGWFSKKMKYNQPANYDERVIKLEKKTTELEEKTTELEEKITELEERITEPNSASPFYRNVNFGCLPYGYFRGLSNSYSEDGFTGNTQYADYIAKFKALMVGHEAYVTETNLGNASDGQAIYLYDFKPVRWDNEAKAIPKIIIVAGQHGAEKCNVFGLYYFVKDLLNNWFNSPQLEYLRHHVELMIVPVTNPYGFDNFINTNANGVNINRNYSSNWVLFDDTTSLQYGGAQPFDQPESQIIRDLVLNNNDCVMLVDSHTNSTVPAKSWDNLGYYGIEDRTDEYYERMRDALPELVSKLSPNWNVDYNLNAPDTRFGFLTASAGGNGALRTWAGDNNVLCVLIEGFSGFVGDASPASPNVFKANEEQMVNWLITAMNYLSK